MDAKKLVGKFDATLLAINATDCERLRFLDQIKVVLPRAAVIHGEFLERIRLDPALKAVFRDLKRAKVFISPVVDFPMGAGGSSAKFFQWSELSNLGADEFDFCLNLGAFLNSRYRLCQSEWEMPARFSRIKVIVHNYYLVDKPALLEDAVKLVRDSGAFCIKDSTGFDPPVDRQKWLDNKKRFLEVARVVAPELKVKLAGGFKTLADIEVFEDIGGADIYGVSAFYEIHQEMLKKKE